jgi:hypothetical protein
MKKQFIILVIIILFFSFLLSGCNELDESIEKERFVGIWYLQSGGLNYSLGRTVTFFEDGTLENDTVVGIYEIKDGKLVVTIGDFAMMYTYDYSFSDEDFTLTLTNVDYGESKVYIKE